MNKRGNPSFDRIFRSIFVSFDLIITDCVYMIRLCFVVIGMIRNFITLFKIALREYDNLSNCI